jgi:hypothetical protein
MSRVLVVGGDRIDGIKQVLSTLGITEINHWSGRKSGDGRKEIPRNIEMIVLVTDWINHSFTARIKNIAAKRGLSVVFTNNGASSLRRKLTDKDAMEGICRKTYLKLKVLLAKTLTKRNGWKRNDSEQNQLN